MILSRNSILLSFDRIAKVLEEDNPSRPFPYSSDSYDFEDEQISRTALTVIRYSAHTPSASQASVLFLCNVCNVYLHSACCLLSSLVVDCFSLKGGRMCQCLQSCFHKSSHAESVPVLTLRVSFVEERGSRNQRARHPLSYF